MTVILVTQDIGVHEPKIAAGIAAGLGLDLVSEEELGHLVAARMHINRGTCNVSFPTRARPFCPVAGRATTACMVHGGRDRQSGSAGDVGCESWNSVGSLSGIRHGIRVHIGHAAAAIRAERGPTTAARPRSALADANGTGWAFGSGARAAHYL